MLYYFDTAVKQLLNVLIQGPRAKFQTRLCLYLGSTPTSTTRPMIARQLLFLFSALGAINGIFLAVYFFSRRPRCLADCMLGALLLAVGVRTAKSAFLFFNPAIALEFRQLGLSACLLIGPLTYLYVRSFIAGLAQLPPSVDTAMLLLADQVLLNEADLREV